MHHLLLDHKTKKLNYTIERISLFDRCIKTDVQLSVSPSSLLQSQGRRYLTTRGFIQQDHLPGIREVNAYLIQNIKSRYTQIEGKCISIYEKDEMRSLGLAHVFSLHNED
jgi:hypothetical protein